MTSEQLFDTIGQTEETLLARSEKPHRAALWIKMGVAAAAVLALLVGLAVIGGRPAEPEALPLIEFETYYPYSSGIGFAESYPTDPISVPGKLAVYQNHSYNSEGVLYGLSAAEAENIIYTLGEIASVSVAPIKYFFFGTSFSYDIGYPGDGFPSADTFYHATMKSDDAVISVTADGSFSVDIAENANIDVDSPNESIPSSDEEWIAKARVLFEQYRELCNLEAPTFTVEHGENTVYVYVTETTPKQFHYRNVIMWFSKNGKLERIQHTNEEKKVEKLADYPTISQADAKELLLDGHFNEWLSGGMYIDYRNITEQQIVGCALMYQQTVADRFFVPYYVFYIDLAGTDYAIENYAVFYVPAIEGRYIKGFLSNDDSGTVATIRPITTKPTAPTRYPAAPTAPRRTTGQIPTTPTTPTTVKPSGWGGVTLELLPEGQKGAAPSGTPITFRAAYATSADGTVLSACRTVTDAATYSDLLRTALDLSSYDDEFFRNNTLICFDLTLPDPSYSKRITGLYVNGDVLEVVVATEREEEVMVPAVVVPYVAFLAVKPETIEGITKIAFYADSQV